MPLSPVHTDPDITIAQTLPGWLYADSAAYDLAKKNIFVRTWQFVADSDSIKIPTQVHPVTLLEGCLDEPLLLTRDKADNLHCLSNVCTHRGTILCESGGHEKALTCRYHGRRFDLDGTFKSMPEFEQTRCFPTAADNLSKIPFASWRKFHFAGIQPAITLDDLIGPMRERIGFLPLEEFKFSPTRSRDYLIHANWALYIDNYLEGFHIPFVHASLAEALDYGEYKTELYKYSNLQLGIGKSGDHVFDLPRSHPDFGQKIAAYYYWLFPNMMFNFYPWGLSINIVRPLGVDRTRVSFLSYVHDESKVDSGAGSGLDRVEREDEAVVEAVHRGLKSRFYTRGRYSPTREQGVHHFHQLLTAALFGA